MIPYISKLLPRIEMLKRLKMKKIRSKRKTGRKGNPEVLRLEGIERVGLREGKGY